MKMTSKLLGFLNRIFDKDPHEVSAIEFLYDGYMNWDITDEVLTVSVSAGTGVSFTADLSAYTISSLSTYIASLAGFTVSYQNTDIGDLSSTILLDGAGVYGNVDGNVLYAHQSEIWSIYDAYAKELTIAQQSIEGLPSELVISTASSDWVSELGAQFGITPISGETISTYAKRIVDEVIRLKCNNISLEDAVLKQTGMLVSVENIDWWYNPSILTKLGITSIAPGSPPTGGYPYWGPSANNLPLVCAFAVIIGVPNIASLSTVVVDTIKHIIEEYRAGGTYPMYFVPAGYFLDTNTSGNDANNALYLCGPQLPAYSQVTL